MNRNFLAGAGVAGIAAAFTSISSYIAEAEKYGEGAQLSEMRSAFGLEGCDGSWLTDVRNVRNDFGDRTVSEYSVGNRCMGDMLKAAKHRGFEQKSEALWELAGESGHFEQLFIIRDGNFTWERNRT